MDPTRLRLIKSIIVRALQRKHSQALGYVRRASYAVAVAVSRAHSREYGLGSGKKVRDVYEDSDSESYRTSNQPFTASGIVIAFPSGQLRLASGDQ